MLILNGHMFLTCIFYYFIEDAINDAALNYLIISTFPFLVTIQGEQIQQTNKHRISITYCLK